MKREDHSFKPTWVLKFWCWLCQCHCGCVKQIKKQHTYARITSTSTFTQISKRIESKSLGIINKQSLAKRKKTKSVCEREGESEWKRGIRNSYRFWSKVVDIWFIFMTNAYVHNSMRREIAGFGKFTFRYSLHTRCYKWHIFSSNRDALAKMWMTWRIFGMFAFISHFLILSFGKSPSLSQINMFDVQQSRMMEMNYCFVKYKPFSNSAITIDLIIYGR